MLVSESLLFANGGAMGFLSEWPEKLEGAMYLVPSIVVMSYLESLGRNVRRRRN